MTRTLALAGAAALAATALLAAPAEAQQRTTRVGVLQCEVAPAVGLILGSRREMTCLFRPDRGRREAYAGAFTRVGLDVGITGRGVLAWTVFAPTRRLSPYQLAGSYTGASAQATLAVGLRSQCPGRRLPRHGRPSAALRAGADGCKPRARCRQPDAPARPDAPPLT